MNFRRYRGCVKLFCNYKEIEKWGNIEKVDGSNVKREFGLLNYYVYYRIML